MQALLIIILTSIGFGITQSVERMHTNTPTIAIFDWRYFPEKIEKEVEK
jgi:hypothetical protein